jgi:hypothetical protein
MNIVSALLNPHGKSLSGVVAFADSIHMNKP